MDILEKIRLTDEKATDIIKKTAKVKNAQDLGRLEHKSRDEILRLLKKQGLSTRQIERLTGINRGVVLKA